MSVMSLLLIALVAIAVLLFLVIVLELPAYVSLLLVALGTALVAGIPVAEVVPTMIAGMGKTLGTVAIVVGLGSMLGRLVEASGAASRLARTFTERFGEKNVIFAVTAASFILGIPVFFDVGFIILAPLIFAFARSGGVHVLRIAMPVAAVMAMLHTVVPPHPGPVAAATATGADPGILTAASLVIVLISSVVIYFGLRFIPFDGFALAKSPAESMDIDNEPSGEGAGGGSTAFPKVRQVPGALATIGVIVLPILMIMVGSVIVMVEPKESPIVPFASFIGSPTASLLVGVIVAYVVIMSITGWGKGVISKVADSALDSVAIVVLVTGAGGVFANVLVETGIGKAFAGVLADWGMPTIVAGFLIAAAMRIAQGSASVAILTAAGLVADAVAAEGYSPLKVALITIAVGFGGLICSHVNDSGFWIMTKYLGMTVSQGLRSWTLLTTACSLVGFAVTLLAFTLVP
ncbi:MAG: gluconate:H+ symporter [Actinomycetaceae bacterium]|nr:gluconate:H+ symporter [Actinomycetaceae bacterium]